MSKRSTEISRVNSWVVGAVCMLLAVMCSEPVQATDGSFQLAQRRGGGGFRAPAYRAPAPTFRAPPPNFRRDFSTQRQQFRQNLQQRVERARQLNRDAVARVTQQRQLALEARQRASDSRQRLQQENAARADRLNNRAQEAEAQRRRQMMLLALLAASAGGATTAVLARLDTVEKGNGNDAGSKTSPTIASLEGLLPNITEGSLSKLLVEPGPAWRMPGRPDGAAIWGQDEKLTGVENAQIAWVKNRDNFPGLTSSFEYLRLAWSHVGGIEQKYASWIEVSRGSEGWPLELRTIGDRKVR